MSDKDGTTSDTANTNQEKQEATPAATPAANGAADPAGLDGPCVVSCKPNAEGTGHDIEFITPGVGPIPGVLGGRVVFEQGQKIHAVLTIEVTPETMIAYPMLARASLEKAAEYFGMVLIHKSQIQTMPAVNR